MNNKILYCEREEDYDINRSRLNTAQMNLLGNNLLCVGSFKAVDSKLDSQRTIHKAVMVYKSLNGLTPDYLSSKFVDRSSVSNYSLRDTEGKLAIPQPHTNYMKNSFSYSGAVLWNSLPIELRQADSLSAFRAGCERLFPSG